MSPDRHQRHALIDWFDQDRLAASSVVVVGAGAVGSEVLKNLCLLGIGRVHVIDFDRIEAHNLTRGVLFRPGDVGRFKAETAAEACSALAPDTRITFSNSDCWQSLSIATLRSCDAVFSCVDSLEARIRLNLLSLLARTDLFNAGIDSRHVSIEMYPFRSHPDSACYECWLPPAAYATMAQRYSCAWLKRVAADERKVPTTTITASVAGAGVASLFLHHRCGHPDRAEGAIKCSTDTVTLASSTAAITRFETCPACSRFQADCHCFVAKRSALNHRIAELVSDRNFSVFLSEPVILDVRCSGCGHTVQVRDVASRFDERLAECERCRQPSNVLRMADALSYGELITAFAERALPVKFIHFKNDRHQFVLELED